jgi:hypothetical protein
MSDTDNGEVRATGIHGLFSDMTEGQVQRLLHETPPGHVNVGPFNVCNVSDYVRGVTVGRDNIPVVLYEARVKMIEGVPTKQEKYAVMVPPSKDLGVVCAGCYGPKMTLWNNARCVSCRTFANHLDTKEDGSRKRQCLSDRFDHSLSNAMKAAGDDVIPATTRDLKDVPACELLHALKGKCGLTTDAIDAIMVDIPNGELLHALKERHEDGLAGYLDHVDLKDIRAYVKGKDKVGRVSRALKRLC